MMSWFMRSACTLQLLVLILGSQFAMAEGLTGILMVEISGLKDASGNVYIAVYDSDSTWLSDEMVLNQKVVIADALDGDLVRTELLLPLGDYALSVFYDQDGDGKLKTNFIGMPKEPIALSNNAVAKFGPPEYDDAVFSLGAQPLIQNLSIKAL
ncbi:MAG: DUF2141 domain-containing protein [Halioglobus sp.]|nr:DUF2141 domain-containing protein [Halioglobus sp.]